MGAAELGECVRRERATVKANRGMETRQHRLQHRNQLVNWRKIAITLKTPSSGSGRESMSANAWFRQPSGWSIIRERELDSFEGDFVKALFSVALWIALSLAFTLAQTNPPAEDAALIPVVKQMPASQLDSALPQIRFEKWLQLYVGKDARIAWLVRTGDGHGLPWVEADVSVQQRPAIVIMIACGKRDGGIGARPRFRSLQLVRKNEFVEWCHLRDLPAAMKKVKEE